jgi:hypothetical protein
MDMTGYEKTVVLNGIAVLVAHVGVAVALIAGILFLPWWPAKAACALVAIYGTFRTVAAYYATK